MREIISFTIDRSLRENIDELRGDIPRSKYIHRILEDKIKNSITKEEILYEANTKNNLTSQHSEARDKV